MICFEVAYDELVRDTRRRRRRATCSSCRPTTRPTAVPASPSSSSRCRGCARSSTAAPCSSPRPAAISAIIAPDGHGRAVAAGVHAPATSWRRAAARQRSPSPTGSARCRSGSRRAAGCSRWPGRRDRAARGSDGRSARPTTRKRPRGAGAVSDTTFADLGRIVVIVPTYNERGEHRAASSAGCARRVPEADVLVVDDNSPDGTGELADALAAADAQVHVLHRAGKAGLGRGVPRRVRLGPGRRLRRARRDGRRRLAPARAAAPAARPRCGRRPGARARAGCRAVRSSTGRVPRKLLSRGGSLYTRVALGVPMHDATGGYRAFRAGALRRLDLDAVEAQGYCFQVDLAWRAVRAGLRVRRGADHVRRARARRLQDEPRIVARGALAGHGLGREGQGRQGPPCRPGATGARWAAGGDVSAVVLLVLALYARARRCSPRPGSRR